MAYFVFDLDETLGNFHTPYYFLIDLRNTKEAAYNNFVQTVASIENSGYPLGIIRPGILDIMRKLKEFKDRGLVKSLIIYSNNSHLASLEFARDVIQHVVGDPGLFSDCIHWSREGREVEYKILKLEGSANKTWAVLSNLMINGPTAATDLTPDKVYFFDDQKHILEDELPPGHTIRMMDYEFRASATRVGHIYKDSVFTAFQSDMAGLSEFIDNLKTDNVSKYTLAHPTRSLLLHTQYLISITRGTVNRTTPPPPPDQSITACKALLREFDKLMNSSKKFEGGKRRINHRRTMRRGKKHHESRRR